MPNRVVSAVSLLALSLSCSSGGGDSAGDADGVDDNFDGSTCCDGGGESDAGGDKDGGGPCNPSTGGAANFVEHPIDTSLEHGQGLQIVDMNGDGAMDLVVPYSLTDSIYIYLNRCESWERIEVAPPGTLVATGVTAADFDGDGDIDIAAAEPFGRDVNSGSVRWFENSGDVGEAWIEHAITTMDGPNRLHAADLSGDGQLDLVVGTTVYGPGAQWFRNTGSGFAGPLEVDSDLSNVHALAVHDVDGDGALDVLTTALNSAEISWYESDRGAAASDTITFTKHVIDAVDSPFGIAVGNLDDDAEFEVVASHTGGVEIYDPPADPTGTWVATSLTADFAGETSVFLVVADLNGDALSDIAVASGPSGTARSYLRDGADFSLVEIVGDYPGLNSLVAGDVDGDGDLDLATSTYEHGGGDVTAWWENRP